MPFIPTYYTATFSNGRCVETSAVPGEHAAAPQHTPGPWTVSNREITGPQDSGVIVARLPEWGILADNPDPAPANARLIAAAPELLAALKVMTLTPGILAHLEAHDPMALKQARAAIAKVTGETA